MKSVFIVDDSALVRQRLHFLISGFSGVTSVGEAAGADEAIQAILQQKPDIVFLDLSLAQGSGFDVLRAVREKAPEVDCYMLSNTAAYPYRQLAQRLGARGFFDKSRDFDRVRELFASAEQPTQH